MTRLRSVTTRPIVAAISSVSAADDRAHVGRRRRLLEQRVHARDQVHAGGHHRRGVDQGGDRRRALHGVREPGVQRDLGGLGERADEQQAAAGHEVGLVARERPAGRSRTSAGSRACPSCLKMKYVPSTRPTSPTTLITNALMPAAVAVVAPVPERDQEVRRGADERPADDQQHEVRRLDQQQHAEHEEVQVREEARVAAVAAHVGDRVQVDQHRDAGDDQHHEDAERVDQDRDLRVDAARHHVVPADRDDMARVRVERLQLDERADRGGERERDRQRADHARGACPGSDLEEQRDEHGAAERERQHEPAVGLDAHPCSSRQLVDVDRQPPPVQRDDQAEADRDLTRRDDHDDQREDLAVHVPVHARERDEREVARR